MDRLFSLIFLFIIFYSIFSVHYFLLTLCYSFFSKHFSILIPHSFAFISLIYSLSLLDQPMQEPKLAEYVDNASVSFLDKYSKYTPLL